MRTCVGCGGQIHDQFILQVAPNLEWHAACLKCSQCHKFLDEKCTCFVRDGKCFVYIMTMQSATYIHTPLINFVHRRRPAMTSSSITNVNNVNHSSHSSSLTTQQLLSKGAPSLPSLMWDNFCRKKLIIKVVLLYSDISNITF